MFQWCSPIFQWIKLSFSIDLPLFSMDKTEFSYRSSMIFPYPPRLNSSSCQRHRAAGLLERGRRVSTWPERPALGALGGGKTCGKCEENGKKPWKMWGKWDSFSWKMFGKWENLRKMGQFLGKNHHFSWKMLETCGTNPKIHDFATWFTIFQSTSPWPRFFGQQPLGSWLGRPDCPVTEVSLKYGTCSSWISWYGWNGDLIKLIKWFVIWWDSMEFDAMGPWGIQWDRMHKTCYLNLLEFHYEKLWFTD